MAQFDNRLAQGNVAAGPAATFDEGLRRYMLHIYNYMAGGVALTGALSYFTYSAAVTTDPAQAVGRIGNQLLTPFGHLIYGTPLMWVLVLAPTVVSLIMGFGFHRLSVGAAQAMFWAYSALVGISLSTIFLVYTHQSVAGVFFLTATAFMALSLFGYVTKRDLSGWASFLFMGMYGIVAASVINMFWQNQTFSMVYSVIGVAVFGALTAWETQQLKDGFYGVAHDSTLMAKSAVIGALNLYITFINMFISMLRLFGNRN
jgi:uncharacterized protein